MRVNSQMIHFIFDPNVLPLDTNLVSAPQDDVSSESSYDSHWDWSGTSWGVDSNRGRNIYFTSHGGSVILSEHAQIKLLRGDGATAASEEWDSWKNKPLHIARFSMHHLAEGRFKRVIVSNDERVPKFWKAIMREGHVGGVQTYMYAPADMRDLIAALQANPAPLEYLRLSRPVDSKGLALVCDAIARNTINVKHLYIAPQALRGRPTNMTPLITLATSLESPLESLTIRCPHGKAIVAAALRVSRLQKLLVYTRVRHPNNREREFARRAKAARSILRLVEHITLAQQEDVLEHPILALPVDMIRVLHRILV